MSDEVDLDGHRALSPTWLDLVFTISRLAPADVGGNRN